MAIPQWRIFINDNIDFHIQLVASMVRLNTLNLLDSLGKAHGQVQQNVTLICRCGCAREIADVRGGSL